MALDFQLPAHRQHLTDDALLAEDLAIRYADSFRGPRSGHFEHLAEYAASREQCMAALFDVIAGTHQVTREGVRESLTRRRLGPDLAVFLSFGAVYGLSAYGAVRWVHRRFPFHEGWVPAVVVTVVMSFFVSVAGVMAGEVWATAVESIRIGTGHLSYRVSRIPWVQHKTEVFAAGALIFWLIALFRYRISRHHVRNPQPRSSLFHLDG